MTGGSSKRRDKRVPMKIQRVGRHSTLMPGRLLPRNQHQRGAEVQVVSQRAEGN
jgi:hypothetical protein